VVVEAVVAGTQFFASWAFLGLIFAFPVLLGWALWRAFSQAVSRALDLRLRHLGVPLELRRALIVIAIGTVALLLAMGKAGMKADQAHERRSETSFALSGWTREDPRCQVDPTTTLGAYEDPGNGVYPVICTPPGMRSGYYNGRLVNDPMCSDIGVNGPSIGLDNDVPCTLPPGDPGS
jgi:hypothetical protein